MPPSPRTPSVISTPAPATPVGWNCQNSMSSSGMPARAAMPRPSPVLMKALVDAAKMRPAPPVANSVVLASRIIASPVSISSATTPSTSPSASRIRSSAIHSTKNCVCARTLRWYSVCSIAWPVRSAAAHARCDRLLAEVRRVAAERTLVDRAVGIAVERHAEVLELVDDVRRFAAHELDRVLVAEPVGALDGVVTCASASCPRSCCRAKRRCRPAPRPCASASGTPSTAPRPTGRLRRVAARRACRSRRRRR